MYSEKHRTLAHPSVKPPRGSIAAAALTKLRQEGLTVILDPDNDSDIVEQYAQQYCTNKRDFDAFRESRAKTTYLNWRESVPERQFYLVHNKARQVQGAVWFQPSEQQLARVDMHSKGMLSEQWLEVLEVIHGYAARQTDMLAHGGVLYAEQKPQRLITVCRDLGYVALKQDPETAYGNEADLMVISPERLEELNAGKVQMLRSPLRLITGD